VQNILTQLVGRAVPADGICHMAGTTRPTRVQLLWRHNTSLLVPILFLGLISFSPSQCARSPSSCDQHQKLPTRERTVFSSHGWS